MWTAQREEHLDWDQRTSENMLVVTRASPCPPAALLIGSLQSASSPSPSPCLVCPFSGSVVGANSGQVWLQVNRSEFRPFQQI